ncbi:glycosyltransferase [uncultured Microbacterium sp.]|uniref:glycosyltransferase n=1 Tax=uncultured Microbacterium sp. TaxID=191216 RepID=UPI0025F84F16|nr:glycosyltransferase [uncultured Microbacterium sp.]
MTPRPLLSIVIPVSGDDATVATALESALAQSLVDIEIICVDDASTDGTAGVLERFRLRDPRVRVVRHERNLSAFQARRTGILAASADRVMFLDGDDELTPDAAAVAVAKAEETDADIVGFGVTVIERDGRTGSPYEVRLQPPQHPHAGDDVLRALFPVGKPAQGQLWRFLFRTSVLREAYSLVPDDLVLPRINDLPLLFLVAILAESYAAVPDKLYRYHFGRGGSGHRVDTLERARFYTGAIRSVDAIGSAVEALATAHADPTLVRDTYASVRFSIIGYVCFQLVEHSDEGMLDGALAHLHTVVSGPDIIHAAARFYPATLKALRFHTTWQGLPDRPARSILLVTSTLRTGGVSAVLTSQARYLHEAGYRVTVVARNGGSDATVLPAGIPFVELTSRQLPAQLTQWAEICRAHEVDVVIDHQLLYTDTWPEFALVARAEGAATIGWLHNFVARPVYDGNDRLTLIERCSPTLAQLVTLSPLDVAYFRLRGIEHVAFLPNPPSPLMLESAAHAGAKPAPASRLKLVWWGRLEQRTKQVSELVEVGVQLRALGVPFDLTIIGPDWDDVTAKKLNALARRRGVGDAVAAVGPLRGAALVAAIDSADAFVSTSIIEGYQLTIAEAQARGLPVFMYELPWLTLVQENHGVVAVPQGDARGLASRLAETLEDPEHYAQLSLASLDAASRARDFDFAQLYRDVVTGALPPRFSPQPTLDDARQLLGLLVFFAQRATRRPGAAPDSPTWGARVWQSAAPLGRATLRRVPGLQPLAHRAKGWLGAR